MRIPASDDVCAFNRVVGSLSYCMDVRSHESQGPNHVDMIEAVADDMIAKDLDKKATCKYKTDLINTYLSKVDGAT